MQFKKGFTTVLLIAIITGGTLIAGGGTYAGVTYSQSKKLIKEADKLVDSGKYHDALDKYDKAKSKWYWAKIESKRQNTEELKRQEEYLALGNEHFGKGEWQKCLEYLGQVTSKFPNYDDTQARYSDCEKKLTEQNLAETITATTDNKSDETLQTNNTSKPKKSSPVDSNNTNSTSNSSSSSDSSNTSSDITPPATISPPVLKNLVVDFGQYNPATGRAGAFLFDADQDKVFLEFGAQVNGPDGPKTLPTFEYRTVDGASVHAAADGYVTAVMNQPETGDYEILVSPNKDSRDWFVGYDHVKGVTLQVGDQVTAGQYLGTVGSWGSGLGRTELQVGKSGSNSVTNYCPFSLFSPSLLNTYKQQVMDLMADWESFKGNTNIYNDSGPYPGCSSETLSE